MKSLAALAFIAASAIALPAYAQGGGPFSQVGGPFDGAASQFGRPALQTFDPSAPNPDWRACTNDEYRYSIDDVTAGCTRVIDRASNFEERARGLWWRAIAYERAGQAELSAADFQSALNEFNAWIEDDGVSIDARFYRASMRISMRQYDQALVELRAVDELLRRQPRVIGSIGRVAFLQGDYTTAIAEFDRADNIARRSTSGGLLTHNRCEARAAAGVDLAQARTICDRAVRISQGHPATFVARGFFRFRQNDMSGALADFERALDREPHNPSALYGRGVIAMRAGQQEAANADLNRARELAPRTVEYYANAGMRP